MNPKTCKMKSMLSGFELPHKIHLYYIIFQKNERIDIQTTFPRSMETSLRSSYPEENMFPDAESLIPFF